MSAQTHTHADPQWASDHYKAVPPDRNPLNSLWFFGLHEIPPSVSSALNSHQPLLLPKITQERHSSPRLTTAQLGRKRGIKTHTKKETHHIVEGGKKSIHTAPRFKIPTDDFGSQRTAHTNAPGQGRGKVCIWASMSEHIQDVLWLLRWHSFLISFCQ